MNSIVWLLRAYRFHWHHVFPSGHVDYKYSLLSVFGFFVLICIKSTNNNHNNKKKHHKLNVISHRTNKTQQIIQNTLHTIIDFGSKINKRMNDRTKRKYRTNKITNKWKSLIKALHMAYGCIIRIMWHVNEKRFFFN